MRCYAQKFIWSSLACLLIVYAWFEIQKLTRETTPRRHKASRELQKSTLHHSEWIEVAQSKRRIFVYSAYYDTREHNPVIRIIAVINSRSKVGECWIRTSDGTVYKVAARSARIREGGGLPYISSFITCSYALSLSTPREVAVVLPDSRQDSLSFIPVELMDEREPSGYMSVCVKPFHYEFNRAVWLVEFIEMHRLLGADHFIFYNHTVGADVEKVLQHYVSKGVASVYSWTLPLVSQKEIRTEGIFSALNDCNLRSVNKFQYAAFVDLDEFIVPRNHQTYPELLDHLGSYDGYIFQNVFFYLYWNNDTIADEILYNNSRSIGNQYFGSKEDGPYLLTAYKTTRKTQPHRHGERSKYISKPHQTMECGNHVVGHYVNGRKHFLNVPAKDALSHHYRICELGGFACLDQQHNIDRTAHRWLRELVPKIAQSCQVIFSNEGKCPEAPPLGSPW